MNDNADRSPDQASQWRQRFGFSLATSAKGASLESTLEATSRDSAVDRVERAREQMKRIVMDQFGGDEALMEAVSRLALTSTEALKILEAQDREPTVEEFSSLEAIVAFDGTRPSFLVRNNEVVLDSSFSTDTWKVQLGMMGEKLAEFAACVGRVEIADKGIGTAFLVAPNLVLTNRHVAQLIADFETEATTIKPDIWLDFGREHQGRKSWDRRAVRKVLFAGASRIAQNVDHTKLDLALLQVDESGLSASDGRDRFLGVNSSIESIGADLVVATVGYPGDWQAFVPTNLRTEHADVLAKLLEGEKGSKRLAPGVCAGMKDLPSDALTRTVRHDATTINGNSGSPLAVLSGAGSGALATVGLHYAGQWQGERTNWAHLLGGCMAAQVTGHSDLRTALNQYVGARGKLNA